MLTKNKTLTFLKSLEKNFYIFRNLIYVYLKLYENIYIKRNVDIIIINF